MLMFQFNLQGDITQIAPSPSIRFHLHPPLPGTPHLGRHAVARREGADVPGAASHAEAVAASKCRCAGIGLGICWITRAEKTYSWEVQVQTACTIPCLSIRGTGPMCQTIVCWHLPGNHHFRASSWVVQDLVHPQY